MLTDRSLSPADDGKIQHSIEPLDQRVAYVAIYAASQPSKVLQDRPPGQLGIEREVAGPERHRLIAPD